MLGDKWYQIRLGWNSVLPAELLSCGGRLHPAGLTGVTSSSAYAAGEKPGQLSEPARVVQWGTHRAVGLMCAHISKVTREDAHLSVPVITDLLFREVWDEALVHALS